MPLEILRKGRLFKRREIWFSDYPYDVPDCHSVTFRGCKKKVDVAGFHCRGKRTLVIDLTQDLDTIWSNMGKKSCRYEIKRGVREGIQVSLNQDHDQFYQLSRAFRYKKGLSPEATEKPEFMKKYGTLFIDKLGDELLGGQLYLEDSNNIRWLQGASKRLEVDREKAILIGCANRLMIWEAIKYAKAKGIKEFDFGGYYTGDASKTASIFKRSFGGEVITHYIYPKDYSKIVQLARRLNRLSGRVTK